MTRRLTRTAGPEHPLLFADARDIPAPPSAPRPRAGDALEGYAAVLSAAEAVPLDELGLVGPGRTVVVAGERAPAPGDWQANGMLDDGRAVVPLLLPVRAAAGLRTAAVARFLLVTGITREHPAGTAVEIAEVADLRELARTWAASAASAARGGLSRRR
ncbi:hypothetical protein OVN20_11935 [Microcella daejeonensis]|uniref:hypothetical protein n=1 Tax=Microcella daejeonensis TaxID=2994971 RepID=UPI00226FC7AF|nr:hypothetical protein [Microcella daejeonensis]WAB83738.1 hypothetical protein OVN20_11935 [Microcella daejeonensis]